MFSGDDSTVQGSVSKVQRILAGIGAALFALLAGCSGTEQSELRTHAVSLVISADLAVPGGGELETEVAYVTAGDFAFFGSELDPDDPFPSGIARRLMQWAVPFAYAHAGHSHGEADFEGRVEGSFVLPLSPDGIEVGSMELPEGHYFDGRFVLGHADDGAELLSPEGSGKLPDDHPARGHTLYLKGSLKKNGQAYQLELAIDLSTTVAGLELAAYVLADGPNRIELVVLLGKMVGALDLKAIADQDGNVVITEEDEPGYVQLKIGLKERLNYVDPALQR